VFKISAMFFRRPRERLTITEGLLAASSIDRALTSLPPASDQPAPTTHLLTSIIHETTAFSGSQSAQLNAHEADLETADNPARAHYARTSPRHQRSVRGRISRARFARRDWHRRFVTRAEQQALEERIDYQWFRLPTTVRGGITGAATADRHPDGGSNPTTGDRSAKKLTGKQTCQQCRVPTGDFLRLRGDLSGVSEPTISCTGGFFRLQRRITFTAWHRRSPEASRSQSTRISIAMGLT
jgi:hypothetical protein